MDKEWKKRETILSKQEVIRRSAKRQKESPLCCIDGHLSSQTAELEPKFQNYKGRVVKDVSEPTQSSLNKASLRLK